VRRVERVDDYLVAVGLEALNRDLRRITTRKRGATYGRQRFATCLAHLFDFVDDALPA